MSEIMELEKTLIIDAQEYNINAKSAEKVENKLTIKVADGAEHVFDGSARADVSVMSPSGGVFTGVIKVPTQYGSTLAIEEAAGFDPATVLNCADIQKLINQLNGYVVYNWNGKEIEPNITASVAQNFGIVIGSKGAAESFIEENNSKNYLESFIYIGTDTSAISSISFGAKGSTALKQLKYVEQANSANIANSATKDSKGNDINSFYQKKITISTEVPTANIGVDGDIWIKY